MKHCLTRGFALLSGALFLIAICAGRPPAARAAGEPDADGFPSWEERVHHELANRARVDPQYEMNLCGSNCAEGACYTPQPPLYYNPLLGHAARFHAAHMTFNSYFAHTSSCTLVSNINTLYPNTCDGSASCSCEGGVNSCNPTCTSTSQRVGMFAGSYSGEIIASGGTPNSAFYLWLYEDAGGDSTCQFTMQNGHRWLILTNSGGVGFGVHSRHVGDFGASDPNWVTKIPSGSHWPRQSSTVEAWANWYDTAGPVSALINVEGTCQSMTLERGTAQNGAYLADITGVGSGCHRYYFVFEDSQNQTVTFPTTGSLGIGPAGSCEDWNTDRPPLGAGCSCTADCAGKNCGDDGCGGSCGTCSGTEQCVNGNCEPLPADGSVQTDGAPGSDGSAGSDAAGGGDGSVSADGSTSGDGGTQRFTGARGGCDCSVSPAPDPGLWLLLLASILLALRFRNRRNG